jgi:hypothetical protein
MNNLKSVTNEILSRTTEVHIDEMTVTIHYLGVTRGKVKHPSYRSACRDLPWLRKYIPKR